MTIFISPVHQLIFNKIGISENRQKEVIKAFAEKYGEKAEEATKKILSKYQGWVGQFSPEELKGDRPIHRVLAELIERTECREACLWHNFLSTFNDDDLLGTTLYEHGKILGIAAGNMQPETITPPMAYEILTNHLLEGMPCDRVVEIVNSSPYGIRWKHSDCVHSRYWEKSDMDVQKICSFFRIWIKGFFKGILPQAEYKSEGAITGGDPFCCQNLLISESES